MMTNHLHQCNACDKLMHETRQLSQDYNDRLRHLNLQLDETGKEFQILRFKQLEMKIKSEKLFKDMLFEAKNFYIHSTGQRVLTPSSSMTMLDIFWRHYKNLFGLNSSHLSYTPSELASLNDQLRSLEQTVESFKAKTLTQSADKFYSTTKSTQTMTDPKQINTGQEFILQVNRSIYDINAETNELREKLGKQKELLDKLMGSFKLDSGMIFFKSPGYMFCDFNKIDMAGLVVRF
jgi:hypothetical protein